MMVVLEASLEGDAGLHGLKKGQFCQRTVVREG